MYLLMPTSHNVNRIIRDFSDGRKQYAAAHLFFVDGLEEQLFQRLTASAAEPHLQALKELFINIWGVYFASLFPVASIHFMTALEAQVFSLQSPALFFNMFSPPRNDAAFAVAKARLEEELLFTSKTILNLCVTLNEFPFIRYYFPSHHPPLGPLKPNAAISPPPPPEGSGRWRTNLARGAEARTYEATETEYLSKVLAFLVQRNLEEHKKANPDFAVSLSRLTLANCLTRYAHCRRQMPHDHGGR